MACKPSFSIYLYAALMLRKAVDFLSPALLISAAI